MRNVVDMEMFITLTSAYTLTSQTAAQKIFNVPSGGSANMIAGMYFFECLFSLTAMSATSGAFGFALGGTATYAGQLWQCEANKAPLATAASAQNTLNTAANVAICTATTNTMGFAYITGKVRITPGGTVIPMVSLGVAAAAIVGVDSYFRMWNASATPSVQSAGNWL